MTEPITNIEDVVEIYFESGSAWIRLKKEITCESSCERKVNELNRVMAVNPFLVTPLCFAWKDKLNLMSFMKSIL